MAVAEMEHEAGFVDKRRVQGGSTAVIGTPANYWNTGNLRTRLLAIGGIFTDAYINSLTKNDMVYALRLNDDAAGI